MQAIYMEKREEGWQEWMHSYKLYDPSMIEPEFYMRYKKFKGLELGPLVHEANCWMYYQDLVPLEALLVCGDALGHVEQYSFHFEVLDKHPLR